MKYSHKVKKLQKRQKTYDDMIKELNPIQAKGYKRPGSFNK